MRAGARSRGLRLGAQLFDYGLANIPRSDIAANANFRELAPPLDDVTVLYAYALDKSAGCGSATYQALIGDQPACDCCLACVSRHRGECGACENYGRKK